MAEKKTAIYNLRVTQTLKGFIDQLTPELRREMNEAIVEIMATTIHKSQFNTMKVHYLGDDES